MEKTAFISKSPQKTLITARMLGMELSRAPMQGKYALFVTLFGELGSGKTLFARGIAQGLGIRQKIHSPTFILMKRYPVRALFFKNLWHVDCYRIEKAGELDAIGFSAISSNPENIIVIEWPERMKKRIPKNALRISLEHKSANERIIRFGK